MISPTVDRDAWLAARRDGITATDIAAIIGLHPFRTALQVWQSKVNPDADDDLSGVESVEWGNRLEPMVAQKFADRHPEYQVLDSPGLVTGPEPWMLATPDRMLRDHLTVGQAVAGADRHANPVAALVTDDVLELKTVGARQAHRWENDETPDEYAIQVMWQMAVTDAQVGWIAALIAGQRYVERRFERDEAMIETLTERAELFRVDNVIGQRPPMADPWRDAQLLAHIYRVEPGSTTDLSPEARLALMHREALKAQRDELDHEIAECEATIKQNLGTAEIGLIDDEPAVTWKESHRKAYTVKATTTRTLRVVKPKGPSDDGHK